VEDTFWRNPFQVAAAQAGRGAAGRSQRGQRARQTARNSTWDFHAARRNTPSPPAALAWAAFRETWSNVPTWITGNATQTDPGK